MHAGRQAVVIGGGPSVVSGLTLPLPADALMISANGHGCRAAAAGLCRQPDYIVSIDDNLENELRPWGVPIVSQRDYCDIQLFRKPLYSSGQLAVWVAWLMGCAPVVPMGMDCYDPASGGTYFHDATARSPGTKQARDFHLSGWRRCRDLVADDIVRAPAGSLLREIFPEYVPGALVPALCSTGERWRSARGYRVRFERPHPRERGGGHHQAGDEWMTTAKVARRLARERVAVILDGIPDGE